MYPPGQCTWYAAVTDPWVLVHGILGDAHSWARSWDDHGELVLPLGQLGTVVCFQPGIQGAGHLGHVAIPAEFHGMRVRISEMNGPAGPGHTDERWITAEDGVAFLYPPGWAHAARPATYVVRAGDTLWGISQKYGTTVKILLSLNEFISDPNRIYPGQKIALPH